MSDRYVDGVFLAADLAVRLTIESAARTIRNHRGRVERARYQAPANADHDSHQGHGGN